MKNLYFLLIFFVTSFLVNAQEPFVFTWNAVSGNNDLTIYTSPDYTYNYSIDFGDGTVLSNVTGDVSHNLSIGEHTITISGDFPYFTLNDPNGFYVDAYKLLSIEQWGDIQWQSMVSTFENCTNMVINANDTPDLSQVIDMSRMFYNADAMNGVIGNWDVSNVLNMASLFENADNFNQPIENWNVSNVTNMSAMFKNTDFDQPLNGWNVSSVTNMEAMFEGNSDFSYSVESWDVSQVVNMKRMFADANSFNQSLINWNVSNVTDMSGMFSSANTFNQPINSWDVSNVTDMEEMFDSAFSFTQLLNNWDTSNVTNMRRMFYNISSYNQPLDSWDVSSVTNMEGMFYNNWDFNQPLTNWDVSSVTNMSSMFENAISFNQPLANWNVANVIDMSKMFSDANVFNQSIGNWNTSNVTDMSDMFFRAYEFNQDINNWDTSNVTTMESMFQDTNNFNSPINDWNVSNVENMRDMFNNASAFNQPLNQWNVSNAWNLFRTFYNASNFNQDLSDWDFYQDDGFMYLTDFVSFTNLDVPNYDALLLSFANSGRENQQVGVSGLEYCNVEARNYLINNGWSIFFDNLSPDCSNIFGSVVFDSDNNGCSMTDVLVSNYLINAEGAEGSYSTNVINGDFDLSVYADSFNVSIQNLPSYFSVSPESVLVDFTSTSSEQVDFCLTANQSIEDLNITILPLDEARPGFEANYKLIIKNVGTQSINNISASLVFDGTMQSFVSAVPSETNSSTNSIDFSIASLNPFEVEEIEIIMQTFVPPTVNGEDVLNFTASVLPSASDYTTNDNTYILEQVVVNAYDPNDKQVLQGNSITTDETEEYLDYIIRFQNTGSANATFVRIEDELDADLDWSTIQITSASHNYTVEITNGNEVEFFFDNINLPYETLDEANSHGYIAYKIKPIESIQLGDVMSGDASIYFDYNLPIITNTVSTTVVENLGVDDVTQENLISVYPNPVEDSIHIKSNNRVEVNTVSILNLQGKVLIKEENNTGYISVNQLSSGVYLLSIKTNLGMFNSRIIKN